MIISIIIVLCVAAAVAAYGLINGNDATFSNLAGVDSGGDSGSGTGHGNNTTNLTLNSLLTGSSSSGSGSGSGSGGHGTGSGGESSHTPTYNPSPSPNPNPNPNPDTDDDTYVPPIDEDDARDIVNGLIGVIGWYAGEPRFDSANHCYYVPIYDSEGNNVDSITINSDTGWSDRG